MKEFVDYYKLLGIKSDADEETIKRAYRRAAKACHPDRHPNDPKAEEKFKLVGEAYSTLSTKWSRFAYDFKYRQEQRKKAFVNVYVEDPPYDKSKDDEDYSSVWPRSSRTSPIEKEIQDMQPTYTELDEDKLMAISRRRYERPERKEPSVGDYALHISKKFIKELNKLKFRKNDTAARYVLRNKKIIAGTLVLFVAGSFLSKGDEEDLNIVDTPPAIETQIDETETTEPTYEITEPTETVEALSPTLVLNRVHRVVQGDILARFSIESNTTQEEIKRVNGMNSNTVVLGTDLIIPYYVDREDLDLYTTTAAYTPNMTLEEYAKMYETDPETLMKLNPEAIEVNGASYTVETDSLLVPEFITHEEYKVLKAAKEIEERQAEKRK